MALGKLLGTLLGCSWGAPGGSGALLSGMLQPPRHVTAAPACYRTLFNYLLFQAGLLHAALGSLLRLSWSLLSLSGLVDSPSNTSFWFCIEFFSRLDSWFHTIQVDVPQSFPLEMTRFSAFLLNLRIESIYWPPSLCSFWDTPENDVSDIRGAQKHVGWWFWAIWKSSILWTFLMEVIFFRKKNK